MFIAYNTSASPLTNYCQVKSPPATPQLFLFHSSAFSCSSGQVINLTKCDCQIHRLPLLNLHFSSTVFLLFFPQINKHKVLPNQRFHAVFYLYFSVFVMYFSLVQSHHHPPKTHITMIIPRLLNSFIVSALDKNKVYDLCLRWLLWLTKSLNDNLKWCCTWFVCKYCI
jgi:hypothetical protein